MRKHRYCIYSLFILLVFGCSSQEQSNSTNSSEINTPKAIKSDIVQPTYFTFTEIAKYAIANLMNQPVGRVSSREEGIEFHVQYKRASDGNQYAYKVKFEGNRIIWANIDGRWRDTSADENITFIEKGKKLEIIQTFSDGSVSVAEFVK